MRSRLSLFIVLLAAFLIRGFAFLCYHYPTGADYGHHTYFADQYLEEGRLPETFPFYQLGGSRWSNLPGGALTYALHGAFAGRSAFDMASITALFAIIEVFGVYLLAFRLFKRVDAALIAAGVAALFPSGALMVAWSAYANIVALALMPYALLAWLDYWEKPSVRTGAVAVLVICGTASVHHLSTTWLGLSLIGFAAVNIAISPKPSLRKLVPVAVAGFALGAPVLLRIAELSELFASGGLIVDSANLADSANLGRFDATRVTWSHWSQTVSAFSLVFLTGGLVLFLRSGVFAAGRQLIAVYAAISFVFGFGWLFDLDFYYVRALYFLSIPSAVGASALLIAAPTPRLRYLSTVAVAMSIGVSTLFHASFAAEYYEGLTPGVVEAADWLREFSEPEDVVVVGTAFGYHMPRLLARPVMVALTPVFVGNPDDTVVARDAVSILTGLGDTDDVLLRRDVKYIIVRAHRRDEPDAERSRALLSSHPRMSVVFQNSDVLIYGVGPL